MNDEEAKVLFGDPAAPKPRGVIVAPRALLDGSADRYRLAMMDAINRRMAMEVERAMLAPPAPEKGKAP